MLCVAYGHVAGESCAGAWEVERVACALCSHVGLEFCAVVWNVWYVLRTDM